MYLLLLCAEDRQHKGSKMERISSLDHQMDAPSNGIMRQVTCEPTLVPLPLVSGSRSSTRTQTEALHNDPLPGKARVPMQLHAHHAIARHTLRLARALQRLQQRKLLRARLPERDGVNGLEVRRVRQERHLHRLRRARVRQARGRRCEQTDR